MTGILGGTFDPPHFGHLVLAEEALSRFGLSKVLLVPSRMPPHKTPAEITPFCIRFEMLKMAVEGNPHLEAADLESIDGPSYTIDLLLKLRDAGVDPVFITGTDSLPEMVSWRRYPEFLDLARFVAGRRPCCRTDTVPAEIASKVTVFDMPGMLISSGDIRKRFARSLSTRYLIPEPVRSFVLKRGLYGC